MAITSALLTSMKTIRTLTILVASALVHFGLTFAIVVARMDCGIQMHCIGRFNEVAGAILSFPLGLLSWMMQLAGFDPSVVVDTVVGGNIFILGIINSFLAVLFVWLAVIKPIARRFRPMG